MIVFKYQKKKKIENHAVILISSLTNSVAPWVPAIIARILNLILVAYNLIEKEMRLPSELMAKNKDIIIVFIIHLLRNRDKVKVYPLKSELGS